MSLDLLDAPPTAPTRDPAPRLWTADEYARIKSLNILPVAKSRLNLGTIEMIDADGDWVPFVFTRKEYYALDDHQFFRDQRVQLIAGEIVQEPPMNPPHANGIRFAKRTLESLYRDGFDVSVQLPVDLGLISEPQPDFAIIAGPIEAYAEEHPKTAVLIIEVSDSTLVSDLTDKASLYAAARIPEYWVIDVVDRVLHVFTMPVTDTDATHGASYERHVEYTRDDVIAMPGMSGVCVAVNRVVP